MIPRLMFLAVLVLSSVSWAADVSLVWNPSDGAAGYVLEMSVDNGQTWTGQIDVGNVTTYTWQNVPDNGMVLFRASAYNTNGQATRYEAGAWYNGDWKPPERPGGMGVE